jgi:predicted dehydrogenase
MRFALLGNHPDGLQMVQALVETGRHELVAYSGPVHQWESSRLKAVRTFGDIEEILADPTVDAVVVAGDSSQRPLQLRRALQSERHVLCVFPPDQSPDIAYEAAMIQADTRRVLLPILPGALHPGIQRLRALIQKTEPGSGWLVQWDRCLQGPETNQSKEELLLPYFPGWEILQALGGSIAEVSAFAENSERMMNEPLLIAGSFEKGGLFQATLMTASSKARWRLRLTAPALQAELDFPNGFPASATLTWKDQTEACRKEEWPAQNLFHEMVKIFEDAVQPQEQAASQGSVTWQDAIRCAELDDAARRSVERRRASTLEYPEATEEATFKGTMTLIGCGMLWLMVVLLILSRWYPALLMVIVLMLTLFLALQLLRLIVKK